MQQMARTTSLVFALLASAAAVAPHGQPAARRPPRLRTEPLASVPMNMYRQDCWKRVPVALTQQASKAFGKSSVPGAGIDQAGLKPFQQVLKDGFFEVDCIKDYLFEHGDKYGNNKFAYQLGDVTNVSIVIYSEVVEKQARKPMSHQVCFSFCRTVPDMAFFGIHNGRTCYCAPYFEAMAGDNAVCDVPCEGNPTAFCGGTAKSSVFEMHQCGTSAAELAEAGGKLTIVSEQLTGLLTQITTVSAAIQAAASELQTKLGAAGDPEASALMQEAKVLAGELEHAGNKAAKQLSELAALKDGAAKLEAADATSYAAASQMEDLTEQSDKAVASSEALADELSELLEKSKPTADAAGAGAQYYPVLYFVDKEFAEVPSTCSGQEVGKPVVGSFDACAAACDAETHSCVGFSYFPDSHLSGQTEGGQTEGEAEVGICFPFSKFTSATYYTGCAAATGAGVTQFLQRSGRAPNPATTKCVAKLSHFEGTSLAPDASGKCEQCLKKATKADRCFA